MNTNSINIGITMTFRDYNESMWINGMKMNAIFLFDALMQSKKNYNVYLINTGSKIKVNDPELKIPWDREKYPIYDYYDVAAKTDLLIMLTTSFDKEQTEGFKSLPQNNLPKKVISYKCGNNYVIEMERALFADEETDKKNLAAWSYGCDDVWFVPQQEYQNKHYYDIFERVDSKPVPFIWNPMFLDEENRKIENTGKTTFYQPNLEKKSVVSFEPNINVVKYSMIPALITEKYHRDHKDKNAIKNFVICSGMRIGVRTGFVSHVKNLEITQDKLLKVDGRFPMPFYLSDKTDVVISHQWENPLNYAYLDALHFNYPLVHNADMVQDAGYYYEGFNIKEGAEQLYKALIEHDSNIEEYNENADKVKSRYMASRNHKMIKIYDKLIENLWSPDKHKMSYEYDWKTNLYK